MIYASIKKRLDTLSTNRLYDIEQTIAGLAHTEVSPPPHFIT
jgi:hypothetical protein